MAEGQLEVDYDATEMLASALKRMDGLIGRSEGSTPLPYPGRMDDLGSKICRLCNEISSAISQYEVANGSSKPNVDPRTILPVETIQLIVHWLSDGELDKKITELQRMIGERDFELQHYRSEGAVQRDFANIQSLLNEKEQEVMRLQDIVDQLQLENEHKAHLIAELNHTSKNSCIPASIRETPPATPSQDGMRSPHTEEGSGRMSQQQGERKSFRKRISRAFSKSKVTRERDRELQPIESERNSHFGRSQEFMILCENSLEEWLRNEGLEQYIPSILRHCRTGAQLAGFSLMDLEMKLQLVNPFHRKKLFLAIKDALSDSPSPEGHLNHTWVLKWLTEIGLPQYKPAFAANLVDGRMLNTLTIEELVSMNVLVPFHILSLKRAIEALRLCNFKAEFFSAPPVGEGSQQVIQWSATRVCQWLASIDLADYMHTLTNQGVHGAFMMLDVRFTEATLAKLLGIPQQQTIIRRHLHVKFMELVGPVTAQKKSDAFTSRAHSPIDPFEKAKKRLQKTRPKGIMNGTLLAALPKSNLLTDNDTTFVDSK